MAMSGDEAHRWLNDKLNEVLEQNKDLRGMLLDQQDEIQRLQREVTLLRGINESWGMPLPCPCGHLTMVCQRCRRVCRPGGEFNELDS